MNVLSLFSGIGGIDLAAQRVGMTVVAHCEIDPKARAVLRRRFPNAYEFTDVKDIRRDTWPAGLPLPDLVAAGWPCQDLSVAGRRAGLAGARSGLFFEFARILAEFAPDWFLGENVPGLLSSNGGRDMGIVLAELGDLGYGWAYRVLDAQFFGVPQRRRRVFFVGRAGDWRAPVEVLLEPEGGAGDSAAGREAGEDVAGTLGGGSGSRGWAPDTDRMTFLPVTAKTLTTSNERIDYETETFLPVAATLTGGTATGPGVNAPGGTPLVTYRKAKRAQTDEDDETWVETDTTNTLNTFDNAGDARATELVLDPVAFHVTQDPITGDVTPAMGAGNRDGCATLGVQTANAVRRLTPTECERLQGFPDGWTDGQSDSARYRQLGNAVAVPCVEWILRRVAAVAAEATGAAA